MKLHTNTVSDLLFEALTILMNTPEFDSFRLVGGTSLSLQIGHRESVDIDLFTDSEYGTIDFVELENTLTKMFNHVESLYKGEAGMGKSFFIGHDESELVKLDVFFTDNYVFPIQKTENIRLASIEEITAMKLEVIAQGGRKKDFWDLHELLNHFSLEQMLEFYIKRYPYGLNKEQLFEKLIDFSEAENDFTPNCYKGKVWEIIKLDFEDIVMKTKTQK
ncbi:MAG: nucleotidyl transferase AbiEii/AbiGii toxin family protein [Flavobacteriales bacterium]|nr:nucleotidyl transferase AbiEii/AbiGii toxin family protein [Flavobacteriales bacterium]